MRTIAEIEEEDRDYARRRWTAIAIVVALAVVVNELIRYFFS